MGAEIDLSKNLSAAVSLPVFISVYVSFFSGDDSIEAGATIVDGMESMKGLLEN
jgi:hypothetical protein|tara:strand:+ start:339 stop:500 length:162 start_codon:yes stop_codon:yes gene_type:complete